MKMSTQKSSLLLTIVVFFWYAQYVYIPYQNPYLVSINVSVNFIGMVIGAYGISQLLLRLPVGILADIKNQHKLFIVVGCFLSGSASIIRVIQPNGIGFFIGNIISGFASAMWISFIVLFLSFYPKSHNASATCKIIMANNLGIFLAFLSSTLIYDKLGMKFICSLSIFSGLIALILAMQLKYPHKIAPKHSNYTISSVFLNKKLLFFSLLALIQQGIQMSTTMSFTNQIIENRGADSSIIGLSSIIYMLSAVFFAKIGDSRWSNKLPMSLWIGLSFFLLAVYCFLVPNAPSMSLILFLQLIPGVATGILFSFLTAEAMSHVPAYARSTAMGLFQAIYAIGMTFFPALVGYIGEHYSLALAYYLLAIIALIGLIMYLLSLKLSNNAKRTHT